MACTPLRSFPVAWFQRYMYGSQRNFLLRRSAVTMRIGTPTRSLLLGLWVARAPTLWYCLISLAPPRTLALQPLAFIPHLATVRVTPAPLPPLMFSLFTTMPLALGGSSPAPLTLLPPPPLRPPPLSTFSVHLCPLPHLRLFDFRFAGPVIPAQLMAAARLTPFT